jgi:hypothetical protein
MGLLVNEQQTKRMVSGHGHFKEMYFHVRYYKFERVEEFSLGSIISHDNDVSQETQQRIVVANKCYYGLVRQLKYRFLSRHNTSKIKLCNTLSRPLSAYRLETWPLKIGDTKSRRVFERNLRAIYGPTKGDEWRIRNNKELL